MLALQNVSLDYPVHLNQRPSHDSQVGGRIFARGNRTWVRALSGISCSISSGERVGIIGRNGSGKSTFLRLCAGIYQPTSGDLSVNGTIATLFTSSLGLSLYQTGRKNIRLGLKLIGVPNKDIKAATEAIAEFSELGDYVDLPMTTYSSGMRTRLGFAIASHVTPDILLVDEVFGAGDISFAKKARLRMNTVMQDANTLVLASHSLAILKEFCDRVLWFDRGELVMDDQTENVLQAYRAAANASASE